MLIVSLIVGSIGVFAGLLSLFWQLLKESAKIKVYAPTLTPPERLSLFRSYNNTIPSFVWASDYVAHLDEIFIVHAKWLRIVNKSSIPVTIYAVEMISDNQGLEANKSTTEYLFDFNEYRDGCSCNEDTHDPFIPSDIHLPLRLEAYGAYEGYIQFRGLGDPLEEGMVKIVCHTSRKDVVIDAKIDYFEGDV